MRATALAILALCALAGTASAYPQYQLSTGAQRCNQCHFAPAGGGLLSNYGRDEAADTISRGGDGSFLHGAWQPPSWLALGGDFRLAGLANYVGNHDGTEWAVVPMQFDLYQNVHWKAFSLVLTEGINGWVRAVDPPLSSWFDAREHYLMWRPKQQGLYLRAGRFFAPFGLRLPEHITFVRRRLGFHTLEETYNLSGGWVTNEWEAHVTAFLENPWRPVEYPERGFAGMYERRFDTHMTLGGQVRYGNGTDEQRVTVGATGKYYLEKQHLLFMGEVDWVRLMLEGSSGDDVNQLASYLSATYFVARGVEARAAWERWDHDLSVRDLAQDGFSLQIQYFPIAHVEAMLYGRVVVNDGDNQADLLMLMLHYYL